MSILKTLREHIVKTSPEYRKVVKNYNSYIDGQESYRVLYRKSQVQYRMLRDANNEYARMYAELESKILDRDTTNTQLHHKMQQEQYRANNQEKSLLQEIDKLKSDHRSVVNSNRKLSAENAGLQMSLDFHNLGGIPFNYELRKAAIAGLKDLMTFSIETRTISDELPQYAPMTITTMMLKTPLKWAFQQPNLAHPNPSNHHPYTNHGAYGISSTITEREAKDIIADAMMDSWFKTVVDRGKDILARKGKR